MASNPGSSALGGAATGAAVGSVVPGIGTAVGAGVGALTGLAGSLFSNKKEQQNTRDNLLLQSKLNKEEMAYSQSLNRQYQDYLNQTQYGAQVAGMRNAGLNPAGASTSIAGMQGSNGLATGPSGPAGAKMDLSGALSSGASAGADIGRNIEMQDAQLELIRSEAKKNNSEAAGQDITNSQLADTILGTLDKMKSEAEKNRASAGLDNKRVDEIDQNIEVMKTSIDHMKQDIEFLKSSGREREAQANLHGKVAKNYDRFVGSQIELNIANAGLARGRNAREGQMLLFDMSSSAAMADYYDGMTYNNRLNARMIQIQNQWNEFLMNQDMKWSDRMKWLHLGTSVVNCVGDNFYKVATGVSSFLPLQSRSFESGTSPITGLEYHRETFKRDERVRP